MSTGVAADLSGFRLFATGNAWNQDISQLPVDDQLAAYLAAIGTSTALHPDFGTQYGIPYIIVDGSTQASAEIHLGAYGSESDPGPFPIPSNAPTETTSSDSHVLALDRSGCWLYEIYVASVNGDGSWNGDSTALWDMQNAQARHDEVARGSIDHALRFTVANTRRAYVAPATHWASSSTSATQLAMGARLRLEASYDVSRQQHVHHRRQGSGLE